MTLYFVLGAAILVGGAALGVAALVAIITAWNALPIHKVEAPRSQEATVYDWAEEGF